MSPLAKRFPRELKNNLGKYLGMFLLLMGAISLTTGFLVAASSIERIIDGMRDTYVMEDGRFTTNFQASDEAVDAVERLGCTVYENFSYDLPLVAGTNDAADGDEDAVGGANVAADDGDSGSASQNATVRIHENRSDFDLAAFAAGTEPQGADEIALDRTFCDHAGIQVGDTVQVGGRSYTVSGIMTLPDYSALFEKNTDFVMNVLTFCVGIVDKPAFEALDGAVAYTYSFLFDDRGLSVAERSDLESSIAEALADNDAILTDLVDAESNQGISYVGEDVEGDQVMWEVLVLLIVVIMAFVFVVLTSSTIESESAVIGTLLASGYRKRELLAHYLALPCFVGLVGAVAGNVLGYTALSEPMRNLYYNSYSLPPYEAFFNLRVLLFTTVVPLVLLVGITLVGLERKLRCSPLEFLRHDTAKKGTRAGLRLPERLGFVARFRLRVFARNLSHFATLFFGIAFASLLLLFSTCMVPTVEHYAENLRYDLVANHQYTLKAPLEIDVTDSQREAFAAAEELLLTPKDDLEAMSPTELAGLMQKAQGVDPDANPVNTLWNSPNAVAQAEKFAAAALTVPHSIGDGSEKVTVYGIKESSRYWDDVDVSDGRVAVGKGLVEKCGLAVGEEAAFTDKYAGETYELTPDEVTGSATCMSVYMSLDTFNRLFGNEDGYFNGYVSDDELALSNRYLAADLTPADMDKIGAQMRDSMGDMVYMLLAVSVLIYLILMYLLTKTVIDRSARAISYMKVFGYRNGEINQLYLRSITATVVASLVASLPVVIGAVTVLFKVVFMKYSGNIEVFTPPDRLLLVVVLGVATYAVVAFLHTRRIKRVPLSLALKVQE